MIFEQLKNNKGTISSKLGKELAAEVLNGNYAILSEAIELVCYDINNPNEKVIRAGAAKIVEKVAEKSPELVAPHLKKLFPGFTAVEPQTRWMLMIAFRYCAELNPKEARKAIDYATLFIREQAGVCLSGATDLYLGAIGALSKKDADLVFPLLLEAYDLASENEKDWILEAFIAMAEKLDSEQKEKAKEIASMHLTVTRKATVKRATKLLTLATV